MKFGYKMKTAGTKGAISRSLNTLMDECQGKREQNLIEIVALRSMMKAKYSTHNIGHYGLAFEYYTHFTSPIRRYPDTMVHRLLTRYQNGGRSASQDKYEELCEHCSDMEQVAQQAERDSIKYKMVEFMADKLGQCFDAHISGIQSYGIYARPRRRLLRLRREELLSRWQTSSPQIPTGRCSTHQGGKSQYREATARLHTG